jgi:hypothetical protein
MADFASENPDCNFKMMSQEIIGFLRNIVEVDGEVDPRDEKAIANIEAIFNSATRFSAKKKLQLGWGLIRQKTGRIFSRKKSTGPAQ